MPKLKNSNATFWVIFKQCDLKNHWFSDIFPPRSWKKNSQAGSSNSLKRRKPLHLCDTHVTVSSFNSPPIPLLSTVFKNCSKCPIRNFHFLHFPPILSIKVTCLVTLFDRKLLIAMLNATFCDFQTLCSRLLRVKQINFWFGRREKNSMIGGFRVLENSKKATKEQRQLPLEDA